MGLPSASVRKGTEVSMMPMSSTKNRMILGWVGAAARLLRRQAESRIRRSMGDDGWDEPKRCDERRMLGGVGRATGGNVSDEQSFHGECGAGGV